jgi:hypothetical protein
MSADGTERTCSIKLVMSAFDPKRTRRPSWVKHSTKALDTLVREARRRRAGVGARRRPLEQVVQASQRALSFSGRKRPSNACAPRGGGDRG